MWLHNTLCYSFLLLATVLAKKNETVERNIRIFNIFNKTNVLRNKPSPIHMRSMKDNPFYDVIRNITRINNILKELINNYERLQNLYQSQETSVEYNNTNIQRTNTKTTAKGVKYYRQTKIYQSMEADIKTGNKITDGKDVNEPKIETWQAPKLEEYDINKDRKASDTDSSNNDDNDNADTAVTRDMLRTKKDSEDETTFLVIDDDNGELKSKPQKKLGTSKHGEVTEKNVKKENGDSNESNKRDSENDESDDDSLEEKEEKSYYNQNNTKIKDKKPAKLVKEENKPKIYREIEEPNRRNMSRHQERRNSIHEITIQFETDKKKKDKGSSGYIEIKQDVVEGEKKGDKHTFRGKYEKHRTLRAKKDKEEVKNNRKVKKTKSQREGKEENKIKDRKKGIKHERREEVKYKKQNSKKAKRNKETEEETKEKERKKKKRLLKETHESNQNEDAEQRTHLDKKKEEATFFFLKDDEDEDKEKVATTTNKDTSVEETKEDKSAKKKEENIDTRAKKEKKEVQKKTAKDNLETKLYKEQFKASVLRQAYSDACSRNRIAKCYKACRYSNKYLCSMVTCPEGFSTRFEPNAMESCTLQFNTTSCLRDYTESKKKKKKKKDDCFRTQSDVDMTRMAFPDDICPPDFMDINYKPHSKHETKAQSANRESLGLEPQREAGKENELSVLRNKLDRICSKAAADNCNKACIRAYEKTCDGQCTPRLVGKYTKECRSNCKSQFVSTSKGDEGGSGDSSDSSSESSSDSDSSS